MSEKDSKMLPSPGDNIGEKILSILNRVTYSSKESDCKNMEKSASSPDSAIDLTEDNKHFSEVFDITSIAHEILDSVIDDVLDTTTKHRGGKKRRDKVSDSDKWNLIKMEGTIGWKRILSRNSDDEGGWGFNFISPSGLKLTIKELEKFLKKKRLDMDDLVFEAHKIELHSYPRKKAKLKIGYPLDKIRDLKLPKKLELERKRKLAQMRQANQPTFKSISEFLASLDNSDCQSYGSDDRDLEETDDDVQDDSEESDRSKDSSFNISVESVSEEYGHCSHIMEEIIHNVVAISSRPAVPLISPNTRIKSLEKNMAEVQMTLSSMLQNSSTPKTIEKLKIKFGERLSNKPQIPVTSLTEMEMIQASPVKISEDPACDSSNTQKIEKLKITPEKLKNKRPSLSNGYVSELNTPTSLKIRKPSGSPERTSSKPQKSSSKKNKTEPKSIKSESDGKKSAKKFSIFKTRNSQDRDENAVNFTDKTVGKKLSIRRSSKDVESQMENKHCTEALQIEIDEDIGINDEITEAKAKPLDSPQSKMPVVQNQSVGAQNSTPARRNIFGPHSPACRDEISPEKSVNRKKSGDAKDRAGKPALRTQSRVLSNEDAIKAIDAVVNITDIAAPDTKVEAKTEKLSKTADQESERSKATPTPSECHTPSLPLLSPHDNTEDSHSNMTTPSLPSLSPAIKHITTQGARSPSLPALSPAAPRRPETNKRPAPSLPPLDPSKSVPLSVEIPPNHISSYSSQDDKASNLNSKLPVPIIKDSPKPKSKSKNKINESPIERSATGRRMRDCRKFIHYEFSPPFASSESSVSELESPEVNKKENFMKRLNKKKFRAQRTQSMTEECLSSPNSVSSNQSLNLKKRGRPQKSKSTDFREEVVCLDDDSNASSDVSEDKKKKRGRPPKKKNSQDETAKLSVSELAENLSENQISPITREKLVFPLSSPNTEERKAKLISQQRESFMLRRNSEETKKARKAKKIARSKSIDVSQIPADKVEDLAELKKNMTELDFNQLLLKNAKDNPDSSSSSIKPCNSIEQEQSEEPSKTAQSSTSKSSETSSNSGATLIVRKSVKVQDFSDPLMTIRDQLAKTSPPPQMINETERPVTPPPGPCTIYQENLDLVDGLRVLTRVGPHFYPGFVKTIESPSIFAVTVDGERGNKPHIYSAEELLDKTILEVKPKSCRYTPVGTRVCVFWSSKLNFLYPGTVKNVFKETQYVQIKLDDGDEREINISNVRLLPKGYPKVVCKDKESPIGVVEANTISPVSVNAIKFVKSPSDKKQKENEFDEESAQLKLKSSGQQKKSASQKLFSNDTKSESKSNAKSTELIDPSLNDDYLKDGMRILTLKDGHFYPGRLNATRPPDIYGVLFDNERGFRPVIYAREQLLKDSVREMRLKSADAAEGTRVCVYWSSKYQYLHPATVIPHIQGESKASDKYVNVVLDDGDTREIHVDQIRLLPPNFPKVVYNEDNPSPRKKSSSRPNSRADSSRPNSSMSNFSDGHMDSDRDIKSPMSPIKVVNGITPPLSRDSTPLGSPAAPKPKVFIPEPAAKPATFDLVGMISSGIDKLVDKKKVIGNRPGSFSTPRPDMSPRPPMMHPHYPGMPSPHPGMQSPHPGMSPSPNHHNMQSPLHPGMQSPHPNMPPQPHYMMSPNPYGYQSPHPHYNQHPPPHQYPPMVPPHPPAASSPPPPAPVQTKPVTQAPVKDQQTDAKNNSKTDAENKAKSRLSNLIQAMSGKIKKPDASPADQILNKWQLAFNVKPPTPTKSPSKEANMENNDNDLDCTESPSTSNTNITGYLTPTNLLCGTRILLMKNNLFYPAQIVTVTPSKMFTIRFKSGTFSETQIFTEQELISNAVLEREVSSLEPNSRVCAINKSNPNTFVIGNIVDFRNGVYVVQLDKGGFDEATIEHIRVLPGDYPKNKPSEGNDDKAPAAQTEHVNKHKHKHNILLGYDFVDENDTDIVAWDRAIQRRKKTDKQKSASPPLSENDIKQETAEIEEKVEVAETKENINEEVKEKVESMLDQVSLEDRMRLSLLSNALKKHSPKKEVNPKQPGNKSPKHQTEALKKDKKRKNSKDSIQKRLSLEDDDLSSDLIAICKESNIDISKQKGQDPPTSESVVLENKIEELKPDMNEDSNETAQTDSDKLTIIEKEEPSQPTPKSAKKKKVKKDKTISPLQQFETKNWFSYIDPKFPENWHITVRKRADGKHTDTYYYTPCNTKLRSENDIRKFVNGSLKSKPLKKAQDVSSIPLKETLPQELLDLTKDIPEDIFVPKAKEEKEKEKGEIESLNVDCEEEKNRDGNDDDDEASPDSPADHVFKVPSLESFRSQKNKSSKLLSPNCSSDDQEPVLEIVDETNIADSEPETKEIENSEDAKVTPEQEDKVSEEIAAEEKTSKPERETRSKRKTRSQGSNSESESETEEDSDATNKQSQSETSGSETESDDSQSKKKRKRVSKRNKNTTEEQKEGNGSDKENDNVASIIEKIESEPINGKIPKAKKAKKLSIEPKKRTLRSNTTEEQKPEPTVSLPIIEPKAEAAEEDVKPDIPKEKENTKKRKASDEAEDERESKKQLLSPAGVKQETEVTVNNNPPSPGKKLLGPRSRRKAPSEETDVNEKKKKNLGPKSKRLSTGDEDQDDNEDLDLYNQKLTEATMNFFKKKKNPKCNIKMLGLFQKSLCKAECGHCQEVGKYTIHLMEFDMPGKTVSMECTSCLWTTIRRITVSTKVVS